MKEWRINNKIYSTQTSLIKIIKNILYSYSLDELVCDNDKKILCDLLKYHPNYKQKIGSGVLGFKIYSTSYKKRGFRLIRIDKSSTDFSYLKCISAPTLLNKIKRCCRDAIKNDIINFKNNIFDKNQKIVCSITGETLTRDNCHIDHYNPTFKEIFDNWYKNKTITESDISKSSDNSEITYFIDKNLANDFKNFHNKIANIRPISIKANLSIKRNTNGN